MSIPLHIVVERLVRLIQLPSEGLTSLTWCQSFPASQETTFPRSLDSWPLDRLGQWEALGKREARRSQGMSVSLALPSQHLWQQLSLLLESPDLHCHSSPLSLSQLPSVTVNNPSPGTQPGSSSHW